MTPKFTEQLAREWDRARKYVEDIEGQLSSARAELAMAERSMAERLLPADAGLGEEICCWIRFDDHDERLVIAKRVMVSPGYTVRVRGAASIDGGSSS